jgi:hypothetical protein
MGVESTTSGKIYHSVSTNALGKVVILAHFIVSGKKMSIAKGP